MKTALGSLIAALLIGGCASGPATLISSDTASEVTEDRRVAALRDGERVTEDDSIMVCKAVPVTGSRNLRRVCHHRDEWVAMRRNGEETVRTTHRKGTMQTLGAPMGWAADGD